MNNALYVSYISKAAYIFISNNQNGVKNKRKFSICLLLRKTHKAKWQIKVERIKILIRDVTGTFKSEKEARKEGKNSDKAEFKVKITKGDCRNRL